MKQLSIVIPCYNEEKNIPTLIEKFADTLQHLPVEIILVNNGSTDNSQKIMEELLPLHHFLRLVNVPVNQGYGFGILSGLKKASGDFLGWTHADLQTDPNDVIKAYKILEQHNFSEKIFIKGVRRGRSIFDQFFTLGMSLVESLYLSTPLWDINGQPTIFHRTFFDAWKNPPHDFSLDLYAYYQAKKQHVSVQRFSVIFAKRNHGKASNGSLKDKLKLIQRTLHFSRKLKKSAHIKK